MQRQGPLQLNQNTHIKATLNLWQDFLINDNKSMRKWVHYFPIYERHFASFRNKSITFLEVGVHSGGSLQMWQRYFGPFARIVGIDIDPQCAEHESPGIFVRIGDQSDPQFLQELIDEFGIPDVILDDGSHMMAHMRSTFDFFYPRMHKNAVYMVEDMHTAYWSEFGGGVDNPESFMNFAKDCADRLNWSHSRGTVAPDYIGKQTLCVSFYDSIVAFEKGDVWWKDAPWTGEGREGLYGKGVVRPAASPDAPSRADLALLTQAEDRRKASDAQNPELTAANLRLRDEIAALRASTSWRATALPRRISGWLKR